MTHNYKGKGEQNTLRGKELLSKIKELGQDCPKADVARACGYSSILKGGRERVDFSSFYEAVIEARANDKVGEIDTIINRQKEHLASAGINLDEAIFPHPTEFSKFKLESLDQELYAAIEKDIQEAGSLETFSWTNNGIENYLSLFYIKRLDAVMTNSEGIEMALDYFGNNDFECFSRAFEMARWAREDDEWESPLLPQGVSLEQAEEMFEELSRLIDIDKFIAFSLYIAHERRLPLDAIIEYFNDEDEGGSGNPEPWLGFIDSLAT